jgi:hypothetical protein
MPDLQSELRKLETLSFNDAGETDQMPKNNFQTTNNITREVFNYVRDNPGLQRKDVIKNLSSRGFKDTSISSLIGQFFRQNKFKFIHGTGLAVVENEYTPLKSLSSFNNSKKVTKVTAKNKEVATIEAVPVQHGVAVKAMLGRMSIIQAREMYDELKRIFEVKC